MKHKTKSFEDSLRLGLQVLLAVGYVLRPSAGSPEQDVLAALASRGYDSSKVGVLIKKLGSDSALVSLNADRQFNPASVAKLVTGAAAIALLGIDYHFTTRVYADGVLDRDSGTFTGNLYIRGGGDPGFLAERLWLFVQHLSHLGIRTVERDLVLDDCFFDSRIDGPGYGDDKSSRAYMAPTAALSASFNTVAVHVAPGSKVGSPVRIHPFPEISGVKIISTAKTTEAGSASAIQVKTERMDGKTAILVYGGMNIDAGPRYMYRKVWQTWENFGWVIQALFDECGIQLVGRIRRGCVPDSLAASEPLYTFVSEPLTEFVGHMFKFSSNFAAEMIFKTIAAVSDSAPGSWKRASEIVEKWWEKSGLPGKVVMKNGSGMGNGNRISPSQVVALLERAWEDKATAPDFVSALSVAGVDGTLEKRFEQSYLKGIVRAKTGTLNNYGVSNLAGFVLLHDETYVFAILINRSGSDQYRHWAAHQKVLETVVPPPSE
jgi:D-alanyl-D-alanine carboxypeptidase/D-alanyl-D-alanine-endopeptidase (penicillin-binding protein 4)